MNRRGQQSRRRRNRHAHKILPPRPPRIVRLRVLRDVEPRQPRHPAQQEQEADEGSRLNQVQVHHRVQRVGKKMESPHERQQTGRYPEGDRVGQRIQLLAELAGRIGHARDAPVQCVKRNRKQDRDRRQIQVRLCILADGRNGLDDREVPRADIDRGKQ